MASLRCTGLKALSPPPGAPNAGLPLAPSSYSHPRERHGNGGAAVSLPGRHGSPRPRAGGFSPGRDSPTWSRPVRPWWSGGASRGPGVGGLRQRGAGSLRFQPVGSGRAPSSGSDGAVPGHGQRVGTDGHTGGGKTGVSPVAPASPKGGDTISPPQNVLEQRVECFKVLGKKIKTRAVPFPPLAFRHPPLGRIAQRLSPQPPRLSPTCGAES